MIKVVSSNVEAVGYDNENKVLSVKYIGGATYEYLNVSREEMDGLEREINAEGGSVGKYINGTIKPYREVRQAVNRENMQLLLKGSLQKLCIAENTEGLDSKSYNEGVRVVFEHFSRIFGVTK